MPAGMKKFLVQAPFIHRVAAGAVLGGVVLFALFLFMVYPGVKLVREVNQGKASIESQIEALESEEKIIKDLVVQIQQVLNTQNIPTSVKAKTDDEIRIILENLGYAIHRGGMTLAGQIELLPLENQTEGTVVRVYQPIKADMYGNLQKTIWFFKNAADSKALGKIKTFRLSGDPGQFPSLSASITLRILKEEQPVAAVPPQ